MSLGLTLQAGGSVNLLFLTVPLICELLCNQSISHAIEGYEYLAQLDFADCSCGTDQLEVDMLIGADNYWKLVTSKLIIGDGPTAVYTMVLSGPVEGLLSPNNSCNLVSTDTLKVDAYVREESDHSLDRTLKTFWDVVSWKAKLTFTSSFRNRYPSRMADMKLGCHGRRHILEYRCITTCP